MHTEGLRDEQALIVLVDLLGAPYEIVSWVLILRCEPAEAHNGHADDYEEREKGEDEVERVIDHNVSQRHGRAHLVDVCIFTCELARVVPTRRTTTADLLITHLILIAHTMCFALPLASSSALLLLCNMLGRLSALIDTNGLLIDNRAWTE